MDVLKLPNAVRLRETAGTNQRGFPLQYGYSTVQYSAVPVSRPPSPSLSLSLSRSCQLQCLSSSYDYSLGKRTLPPSFIVAVSAFTNCLLRSSARSLQHCYPRIPLSRTRTSSGYFQHRTFSSSYCHRLDPRAAMPTTLKEFESVFPQLVADLSDHCKHYKLPDQALTWFQEVRKTMHAT